jgi:predicted nucleotidyltransferase
VRDDLRPDSDIDLFVEPKRGRRIGLLERVDVIADAERLFDRDVDLVAGPITRRALAERIDQDGVVLCDAAG